MAEDAAVRYAAKTKRIADAIALKEPDRVPIIVPFQTFVPHYAGVKLSEAMRDRELAARCYDKFFADFDPDLAWEPSYMYPLKAFEILGLKWLRWPGHGIGENTVYQFLEGEYMQPEEYDEFLFDPTRFILTKWFPRSFSGLEGFRHMTGITASLFQGFMGSFLTFGNPEVQDSLKTLMAGADELCAWSDFCGDYAKKMKTEFGIPCAWGAYAFAPFDMVGDSLRGTLGVLMDMRDRPEKLMAAMEKFIPIVSEAAIGSCAATGRKYVWMWLHKGVDEFMSKEDYRVFYWEPLKRVVENLVEAGLTPVLYGEGQYNTRLEIIRDVPVGKVIWHFEYADMKRAKELLGGVACISGNVPNTLLHFGSPEDVKDYCRSLLADCKAGGGFIMDTGGMVDDARPENIKAMFDITRELGAY